jgi:general secretion pathway protein G
MIRRLSPPIQKRVPHGFTLIEVMIVVLILGVLAAVIVPRVLDRPDEARMAAAQSDIRTVSQALKLYKLDNGSYPSTDQGLKALIQKPQGNPPANNWKAGGYLERLPKDPWGSDYQFLYPGVKGEFDLFSLGADRAPGGDGAGADVGNWQ